MASREIGQGQQMGGLLRVPPESAAPFDAVFMELRPALLRICESIVGDDGEDIVQDVYMRASARLKQLNDPGSMKAWLTKIAVNACFYHHRRRQRFANLIPLLSRTETSSDPDLRRHVQTLQTQDRTIVVLHYAYGLELNEIAQLLNEKPATIRSKLFRARKRLRAALEADG